MTTSMTTKQKRVMVLSAAAAVALGAGSIYFGTTSSAVAQQAKTGHDMKMGGMKMAGGHGMQMSPEAKKMVMKLQAQTPAKGYLKAHMMEQKPFELLGGPINISIEEKGSGGGVIVALPAQRELDEYVFGTPDMPRAFGGTPGITGVPPMFRNSKDGHYTNLKKMTPFGDKFIPMSNATLKIKAVDATATDCAKGASKDSVMFEASWQDAKGNTYSVKCNKVIPHGMEFPTFGGVVTNHLLHGWTGVGTPLMPTEYTYFAFWGMGAVSKNGEVLDKPRLVHGMLTEYVRKAGYKLAKDDEVTPSHRHFHLMVAPFMPDMETGHFKHVPVKTGFMLPNGMELPFWHVMFDANDLDIKASR